MVTIPPLLDLWRGEGALCIVKPLAVQPRPGTSTNEGRIKAFYGSPLREEDMSVNVRNLPAGRADFDQELVQDIADWYGALSFRFGVG